MSLPYPEWHRPYVPSMAPPNKFWGTVTKDGEEVPDGQLVYGVLSTIDDSGKDIGLRVRGKCITEKRFYEGKPYNYLFNVPTEGTVSWESGVLVEFYLGTEKAKETRSLEIMSVTKLDLHIGETPPPPSKRWLLIVGIITIVLVVIGSLRISRQKAG